MSNIIARYKICVIGDGGCGKTTFITRFVEGEFKKQYIATIGAETRVLTLLTQRGYVEVELWDIAGQNMNCLLSDAYFINADAALVFYDCMSRNTKKNVKSWHRQFVNVCGVKPIVIVGNKFDLKRTKDNLKEVSDIAKIKGDHVNISAKSNYNLHEPFNKVLSQLLGFKVVLSADVQVLPAEIAMTQEAVVASEQAAMEMEYAKNVTLPDDDEEDMLNRRHG